MISDLSLAIFITNQLRSPGMLYYLGRAVVIGATVTALGGVFYLITKTDLYFPLTGIAEQGAMIDRARGLSIEPRVLGLSCAYGIMVLLLGRSKIFKVWPVLIMINLVVLLITYSASSYVLLIAGALTATVFFSNKERAVVAGTLLLAACITIAAVVYFPERVQYAIDTLEMRLDPDFKLSGIPPGILGQEIAYRLDVFDASALLFLLDQPFYALIGTGPGMVSLPASYYVPPGVYSLIWTPEVGVNSLPFHGLLLEVSNSGLLGLILWLIQIFSCWRALRLLSARIASRDERLSLKSQCNVALDVIVADSGSQDGTVELCRRWNVATTYVEPGNMYSAINAGLEKIETEWLTYLNSDDWFYPDTLCRLIELGEISSADVVYGNCDYFDGQGRFVYSFTAAAPAQLMSLFRLSRMGFAQPAAIFRRSLYQRLNGFDTQYRFKSDADFFIRALKSDARFMRLGGPPLACFRLHPRQFSNRKREEIEAERKLLYGAPDMAATPSDRLVLAHWQLKNFPNYFIRILRESMLSQRLRFPRSIELYNHQ